MANFPSIVLDVTGSNVYITLRNAAGEFWDTAAATFETLVVASWADYDIVATETPVASYQYIAAVPATLDVGVVYADVRVRVGVAPPAITDRIAAQGAWFWDGSVALEIASTPGGPMTLENDAVNSSSLAVTAVTEIIAGMAADGVDYADIMTALMAVLLGNTTVSGSNVAFKQRDDSVKVTVDNDNKGSRSNSTIL